MNGNLVQETLKVLLAIGLDPVFKHERLSLGKNKGISPKGGTTNFMLYDKAKESGYPLFFSSAHCNINDTYCKQIGRQITLGRSFKHPGFRKIVNEFWHKALRTPTASSGIVKKSPVLCLLLGTRHREVKDINRHCFLPSKSKEDQWRIDIGT